MRTWIRCVYGLAAVWTVLGSGPVATASPLDVLITERPPYYVIDDKGAVSGVVGARAVDAFGRAGLEVTWTVVSFNRQLQLIEAGKSPVCGIGWYKNPDREKFAKFTRPIYQDKALIALARVDNDRAAAHRTLGALMDDATLTLGKKLGFSYGIKVDRMIETLAPKSITTDQSNIGMTRMLLGRRFDYMISVPEEAAHIIGLLGAEGRVITQIELTDLPPQNMRYIMCSKSVGDDVIERLNAAIEK